MAESASGAPLRITIVQGPFLPVPPLLGGAIEKAMAVLGREWARAGHEVTHLSRRYPGLPDAEENGGVRQRRLPSVDMPGSALAFRWHELRFCRAVRATLPTADVIVSNLVLLPLLPLPRRAGRLFPYLARHPKHQVGLYFQAAALLAASRAVATGVARVAPWMAGRTRVVRTPLADDVLIDDARGDGERRNDILFVGRLHPEKGIEVLIDAFRHLAPAHPGWRLRIVGPWRPEQGGGGDAYRDALLARAGDAAGRIAIEEPIFDPAALRRAYAGASLFVYPSIAERGEALPMAPLEAMACGTVPVVSALAVFDDYLRPGANGFAYDHRGADPAGALAAALAPAMAGAIDLGPMRHAARATAASFAPAPVAQAFERAFRGQPDG